MKTCYIVGAGDFYGAPNPKSDDLVIAADGGYEALKAKKIRCDLLIGDMDSLEKVPDGVEVLRYPVEKDETDMQLAYLEGKRRGYSHFEIYGGVGGRPDHTFANYCLLSYISLDGNGALLHDKDSIATAITNSTTRVTSSVGKGISIFAFGGIARGVTLRGLYYGLKNGSLKPEFPLGVSNRFAEDAAEISVREGTLLIIREK